MKPISAWQLAEEHFSRGYCHTLAKALAESYDLPLVGCWFESTQDDPVVAPYHICVRTPDGRLLDIQGLHTEEEMIQEYPLEGVTLSSVSWASIKMWMKSGEYTPPSKFTWWFVSMVMPYMQDLLAEGGVDVDSKDCFVSKDVLPDDGPLQGAPYRYVPNSLESILLPL